MNTYAADMNEVEQLLGRDMSSDECSMFTTMRDGGKSPAEITAVLAATPPTAVSRDRRYEGIGSSGVVDITAVAVPEDILEPNSARETPAPAKAPRRRPRRSDSITIRGSS